MKRCNALSQLLLSLVALCIAAVTSSAQVQLNAVNTPVTIDFTGYTAQGFAPAPAAGQLNSNNWASTGMSDGDLAFGGTQTGGDYARGLWNNSTSGGFYYVNQSGNTRFVIQPTGADFNPGTLTLRVQNNTGQPLTRLSVGYDVINNNSGPRANSFNFSYSTNNSSYTSVPGACGGDYTSPEAADALGFVVGASKSLTITGLNVPNGGFVYLRWSSADVSGSGNRDQFGLDNIVITSVQNINTAIAINNYTFSNSSTTISNPTTDLATVVHGALVDDAVSGAISLPFTFYYNGKPYDRVAISSNGWVALGNSANSPVFSATMTSVPLNDPESWEFNNTPMIAVNWDNLRVGAAGAVSYGTVGGDFKVRWRAVEWPATATSFVTFELTLSPTCNRITFSYDGGSNSPLQSSTVGLINDADNTAPNNYWVFNGAVTPGNLSNDANSNANTRLITYSNLPTGANPSIFANHYDALRVEGPATVNFGNADANGGVTTASVTVRNLGCSTVSLNETNIGFSNSQFTAPAFSTTIAPGSTASVAVRFTGTCPFDACQISATMAVNVAGPLPVVYPADGANLTVLGQETHPVVAAGTLSAFPSTTIGSSNSMTVTLTNTGNVAYNGTLSVSGNASDAALFTISPNPVTVPAGGSTVVTVTFTPTGARHAANANATNWTANYTGLQLVVPNGNQACSPSTVASLPITASSTAPRISINVPNSTEIPNNQGIPTLDIGNRVYGPTPGNPAQPMSFSETFLVKNTGSAQVTINDITRGAAGSLNLNDRFSASAVRISGNAVLNPGNEAVYRVTYTPQKTTSDFPYFEPGAYATAPSTAAYVRANALYTFNTVLSASSSSTATVPAVAGFWHNYQNGLTSTFAPAENLTQQGTMNATTDIFRGFMRTVATPSTASNQGPTNPAGAPVLSGGSLMVNGVPAVNVSTTNGLTVTSYYGVVGDVLPNGGVITNAGQPGTVSFYVVNTGTANARYYVRKQVVNDNVNPGAFSVSVPIPGDNANPALSIVPISSETINGADYHVFTLEPLYLQTAGNSMAYVRFDVTFKPNRANTPDITTIAQNRIADVEILTDANLPTSSTASVEPRNDLTPYRIRVTGQTLFNDPAFFIGGDQITGTVNFGSHELADATSSNYPFGSFFPAGIGYFAPADELGRRGLATGVNGPRGFGVRDTVISIAIENRGNAPMTFNNLNDLQAFALSGSPGTFSVIKVTDQSNINSAGSAEPAAVSFPYTLNTTGQRLILWVRYDAGSRSTGATGQSNGTIRLVQSPLVSPTPSTISLSGSLTGTGIRPFPIVDVDGGNGGATVTIVDGTERVTPVFMAHRPAVFDNYCNLGGVNTNRDTVHIPLTIGNGIPAPTQAGGSLPFDNVNDNAVTDVTFNMNNIVIDSLAGNLVIPGASTSYVVDYSTPVVVRNAFGTVVRTQDISDAANRMVTVGPSQTMTFTVALRPTTLNPTANSIRARVRVAHDSRNNNIDFRADQGPSHTNNSNPTEYGDVYKWMDFVIEGSSLRPAFRLEAGNNAGSGMLGNYIAPNATINDFNLPYPYQPGVFVGDSSWVALTLRNSQETGDVPTGADVSTGKVGIKAIYIEGEDFPDFEIVGFDLPMSTNEPNPVAFPVRTGADNGSPILVNGKSFVQWTAEFGGTELGMPYMLDRGMTGMEDVSLYVHFKPRRMVNGSNKEVRNAVLRIVTTDLCAPELVYNLEGRALNSELSFDKTTINFGNVQVNDVAQQTITMTNNGNSPAYFNGSTIPMVFPSGPLYSHNFTLYPLGFSLFYANPPYNYTIVGDTETPLNPGDSRTIAVQYSPSEGGRKDATMNITYVPEVPPTLDNDNIAQIEIVGRGVAPVTLVTDPISGILDFGNVVVGSTKTLPITITNTGQAPLRLDLPAATMGEFSHNMGGTSDVVLNAGESVTLDFTYAPDAFGSDEEIFTISVPNGFGISTVDIVVRGNGASGAALSASDITFPITRVFTESVEGLFVNNTNNLNPTTLVYNGISGVNADEFELRMNGMPVQIGSSFTVPAGGNSSNFEVVFMPTTLPATAGTINVRNARLNFTMNGSQVSVAVDGEGAIPQISFVSPDIVAGELDFGSISGTAQRTVRVYNIGRFPLNVTQLLLMGEDANRFELGNVQDVVLGPGEWIDVRVTLACDGSSSIEDARLTAISNSLQARSVELRGACAIPQIGISATSIAFGRTEIGKTIEKTLTIRSATGQPLTVTGLSLDGMDRTDFTIASTSKTLPATISGGEELVVIIRFAPTAEGSKQARVRIASTVGQTEVSIDGLATVPGTVTLSQQTVNFGSLPVGKSREMSVNVTNHASTPALINSITVEGDDRAMFTADVTGGFTLQAGETRTVRITFVPVSNGSKFAILRVMTASGVQPVASLTGKGGSAKISVINMADFGTVAPNSFREVQITVNSTGDEALVINSAYVSGPSNADFSVLTSMPLTIEAGQSANITVRFMPTENGSKVAYLNLLNNSGNAGTVELRGNSITTEVGPGAGAAPMFGITQTYPNPFSETATIAYTIGARANVVVKVFNQLGEEVATLFNGVQESGDYTATLKAGTLPAGTYVVRLEAGNQSATQKITLVK